jgi:hypothetical protein
MRACTGLRLVIVALIALAAVLVMPLIASAADYADVPTWYWAWNYVQGVSDAGVSSGYDDGYWRPSWVVSRDQMAVFIARAMCGGDEYVPTGPATASFEDVPNTGYGVDETDPYWAYDYIEYAVAHNITSGYDDGLYHPDWEVTRGQMAAFMARAMCGGEESVPDPSGDPLFPDVTDTENSWCYKHVEYIAGEEVTLGYPDGNYYPDIACAREQMAAYLCRAFDLATPTAPAYSLTDYYPLGEGDTWVSKTGVGDTFTRVVSGTVELHGRTCVRIVDEANGDGDYWISQPDGLYHCGLLDSDGDVTFDPPVRFPNGAMPGDLGSRTTTVYQLGAEVGTATFNWEFVGVEAVTVPAGTFEGCMKMHLNVDIAGQVEEFQFWLAKDVGMVKRDTRSFGGTEWWELLSADVGGTQYP